MGLKQTLRYPHELLQKAEMLIREGRVIRISPNLYFVHSSRHSPPTYPKGYTIEKLDSGVWVCQCTGFKKRRVTLCAHTVAVMRLEEQQKKGRRRGNG